jgi:hypothetical protein
VAKQHGKRDIPRVWEIDWAIPLEEDGTPWEAYDWLLDTARELDTAEVSIAAATYQQLGGLDLAIGDAKAGALRLVSMDAEGWLALGVRRFAG